MRAMKSSRGRSADLHPDAQPTERTKHHPTAATVSFSTYFFSSSRSVLIRLNRMRPWLPSRISR